MSARDAESGSSSYKGGSGSAGGLGNGGLGGGRGGGGNGGFGMGGGAARNGGIGNRTGLTTGNKMYGVAGRDGVTFSGRPGGFAQQPGAFGVRPGPAIQHGPLNRPAVSAPRVPGLLDNPPAVADALPPSQYSAPAWSPPYSQMPSMYDVQPGLPPLQAPSTNMSMTPNDLQRVIATGNVPRVSYVDANGVTQRFSPLSGFSNSLYSNPRLGTPAPGGSGLGNYSNYRQGTALGGKASVPNGVRY